MGSFKNGEFWSEIFFEACLISFFVTFLYFYLFIGMEEHVILEQMKKSITELANELIIPLSFIPDAQKQEYVDAIKSQEDPPPNIELAKEIEDNNDIYYKKAIQSVIIYSGSMFVMSIVAWKSQNQKFFDIKRFVNHVVVPAVIATGIVISIEVIFIQFILGNFIAIDQNKTMLVFLDSLSEKIEN
jgi:hypothetical protein